MLTHSQRRVLQSSPQREPISHNTHDYEVNLKAEIEIMALHDKLDQLRNDQRVAILARIEAFTEAMRKLERGDAGEKGVPDEGR